MPVPDVVVVDHHDSYTWNLVHLIAGVTGVLPRVVQHDEVSPAEVLRHSHVVLSPGPGHPTDPDDFAVGREVLLARQRPVLGVCLGMQGMVTTFGGTVARLRPAHGEVAAISHRFGGVFARVPRLFRAVRYHSLGVRLPDRGERSWLEGTGFHVTAVCTDESGDDLVMGIGHHDLPYHGVQFHPESVLSEHGALLVANFLADDRG